MNEDVCYERYGLRPNRDAIEEIRQLLCEQVEKESESQGAGDTELMKLLCAQLFNVGEMSDVSLIWSAKRSSFDAGVSLDIQLMCGAGLGETIGYLKSSAESWAADAVASIEKAVADEDLEGFTVQDYSDFLDYYYEDEEDEK